MKGRSRPNAVLYFSCTASQRRGEEFLALGRMVMPKRKVKSWRADSGGGHTKTFRLTQDSRALRTDAKTPSARLIVRCTALELGSFRKRVRVLGKITLPHGCLYHRKLFHRPCCQSSLCVTRYVYSTGTLFSIPSVSKLLRA